MKTYFISGATGLIGSNLAKELLRRGEKVVVFVREEKAAQEIFSGAKNVTILTGEIMEKINYREKVDFIIHTAAPTTSKFFVENPVETIDAIINGTKNILQFAQEKAVESIVNLSSMEVYGESQNGEILDESQQFYLDPNNLRSTYPMAKRAAENLCRAYFAEFSLPVKTVRLAQVIPNELLLGDNRLLPHMIRAAVRGDDITLETDGETAQSYIALDDALKGILTILHSGKSGEIYNLADDDSYNSIKNLAKIIAEKISPKKLAVRVSTGKNLAKYPKNHTWKLNSKKARELGWRPEILLEKSLRRLYENEAARKIN